RKVSSQIILPSAASTARWLMMFLRVLLTSATSIRLEAWLVICVLINASLMERWNQEAGQPGRTPAGRPRGDDRECWVAGFIHVGGSIDQPAARELSGPARRWHFFRR